MIIGYVTGLRPGTVTITAKINNFTKDTCSVDVSLPWHGYMNTYQRSIYMDQRVGGYYGLIQLKLTGIYASKEKSVRWVSDNRNIAIVSTDGWVRGLIPGRSTVIRAYDGNREIGKCTVYNKIKNYGDYIVQTAARYVGKTGSEMFNEFASYGQNWYGYNWCSLFASHCYNKAGCFGNNKPMQPKPNTYSYLPLVDDIIEFKNYHKNDGKYTPKPGDLIVFDWGRGGAGPDHVGIVAVPNYMDGKILTIEGNMKNSNTYASEVTLELRDYSDPGIAGFLSLELTSSGQLNLNGNVYGRR